MAPNTGANAPHLNTWPTALPTAAGIFTFYLSTCSACEAVVLPNRFAEHVDVAHPMPGPGRLERLRLRLHGWRPIGHVTFDGLGDVARTVKRWAA